MTGEVTSAWTVVSPIRWPLWQAPATWRGARPAAEVGGAPASQTGSDDLRGLSAEKILEDDAGSIAGAVAVCVVEGDFPDGRCIVEGYHGRVLLDGDDAPRIEHGALVFRMGPGTERSRVFVGPS